MTALGPVGVWCGGFRMSGDAGAIADAAAELEELGYGALWVPGGPTTDVLPAARRVLGATGSVPVATAILAIWVHDPADVADEHRALEAGHPGRFLLGLGVGHPSAMPDYHSPVASMAAYLDALEARAPELPARTRLLAALGPRMLELARTRTAGAHPYLVPVEHTRAAREALGPDALLAPELPVILESDPARARELARAHIAIYLKLPNYTRNLLRHGFGEDDLRDGGSDRLVDGLVAWGDEAAIAERIGAHREAGADHVCIQVASVGFEALPREDWRRLAPALL